MKKVLYISNYKRGVGGISAQVDMLRDYTNCEGFTTDIFSTKGGVVKRLWKFIELLFVVRRYNVLHIHGCSEWGMLPVVYGVIAGKIYGKRIIVTYHGGAADGYFARHGAFARRWMKRADKVIVLNGYLKKVFDEHEIPCVIIPNIVKLSDAQEHSAYQWEALRLISVRHLKPLYNIPCILKAFAIVKEQVPGATLTVLGDGEQRAELEQLVEKLKVESGKWKDDSVKFIGQVENKEMGRYLAESDIMLSAPHTDNMPVSLMEAMNAGVLVISSNVGGVPYMIVDQKTGLLFEDDNAEEMAGKIMQAIANPKQTEKMIARAKEDVRKYDWTNIREQLISLYNG